jgi:hypothetical protein
MFVELQKLKRRAKNPESLEGQVPFGDIPVSKRIMVCTDMAFS